MDEYFELTHKDIYKSWGKNKNRIDFPLYGLDIFNWKQSTPKDIQKIILDYQVSRKIDILCNKDKKNKYIQNIIPKEKYNSFITEIIVEANILAKNLIDYLSKNNKKKSQLLAVGIDGTSLYQPRKEGDIDIFILFRVVNKNVINELGEYFRKNVDYWNSKRIDVRLVSLYQSKRDKLKGSIHFLAFPHKIVEIIDLKPSEYLIAVETAKKSVRMFRNLIYNRCRYFIKILKKN